MWLPNRHQAIDWSNGYLVDWRICTSPALNVFTSPLSYREVIDNTVVCLEPVSPKHAMAIDVHLYMTLESRWRRDEYTPPFDD